MRKLQAFPYNLLILIVIVSFVIRFYNLNFNSIFVDEAAYIVIGQKILSGNLKEVINDITWVGGFPFVYPFFAGLFYEIGGIIATRFFNVVLGTVSVALVYFFTLQLDLLKSKTLNQISGLIAAVLMGVSAIAIETSRLAIYDALSFTVFLLGLNLFLFAVKTKNRLYYLLTALVLFFAFLAKYTPMFFMPFILMSGWFITEAKRKNFIRYLWIPVIILFGLYFASTAPLLIEFFTTQVGDVSTPLEIFMTFSKYSWLIYAISFLGVFTIWKTKKYEIEGLYLMSLVPLIVHILTKNNNTMHQHVFLSIIFVLPLASAFFAWIIEKNKITGICAVAAIVIFSLIYANTQVKDLETFWPNSNGAVNVLAKEVGPKDIILAEGSDTILLGLKGKIPTSQLIGPFTFSYQNLEDEPAYEKAISDGYFKFIEIENEYFSEDFVNKVLPILNVKYVKIFDDGRIQIYRKK